jgi:hypothetical protein
VCECLQFNDDWTPAHLTGGPMNLYKEMDLSLKDEEWRQPGLVSLAAKLAIAIRALESAGPSKCGCPHRTSRRGAQIHGQGWVVLALQLKSGIKKTGTVRVRTVS